MIWTSPFAIFFYVLLAFNLVTFILARSRKEKEIANFLRLPPDKRTKRIEAYKRLLKTQKIPTIMMPILIPLTVGCHFLVVDDKDMFLFLSGVFALVSIFLIEERHFRKSMTARLETAQNEAAPQITISEESPAVIAARVRKVKIILFLFLAVVILGPPISLYFTVDMPWWLLLALIAFFTAEVIGIMLFRRRREKKINSHR